MDKSYLYDLICDAIGSLAGAQTLDDITSIKRVCAQVEHALRCDVLPELNHPAHSENPLKNVRTVPLPIGCTGGFGRDPR
jgi:hypothetical protein